MKTYERLESPMYLGGHDPALRPPPKPVYSRATLHDPALPEPKAVDSYNNMGAPTRPKSEPGGSGLLEIVVHAAVLFLITSGDER